MGANASTAVPLYASGQVLDAARLNLTNAGIPVFSGTATRDAAFGGSGEKVLAEGQFAYLEDTNALQFYDSAAWQAVNGLSLIASASYSAATSFTISNCFTSTYRNYYLIFDSTGNNAMCSAQLLVGGTASTTGYGFQVLEAGSTSVAGSRSTNQTSMNLSALSDGGQIDVMIYRPALAQRTGFISRSTYGAGFDSSTPALYDIRGIHNVATAYDSITVTGAASGLTGKYSIYGLV